jgi:prepilin-type N-terminal cleavage/methylation domain-containing protein/prepilin-type processing-associated H-X9-DG protein
MKRKGFTLIELLLVMAIIALLIALLIPALSSVAYIKRDHVCQRRIKEIGIATASWRADNKNKAPLPNDLELDSPIWWCPGAVYYYKVNYGTDPTENPNYSSMLRWIYPNNCTPASLGARWDTYNASTCALSGDNNDFHHGGKAYVWGTPPVLHYGFKGGHKNVVYLDGHVSSKPNPMP